MSLVLHYVYRSKVILQFGHCVVYFFASLASKYADSVRLHVPGQGAFVNEARVARVANVIPVVAVHVLLQKLKLRVLVTTNATTEFVVFKLERNDSVLYVRVYNHAVGLRQMRH